MGGEIARHLCAISKPIDQPRVPMMGFAVARSILPILRGGPCGRPFFMLFPRSMSRGLTATFIIKRRQHDGIALSHVLKRRATASAILALLSRRPLAAQLPQPD